MSFMQVIGLLIGLLVLGWIIWNGAVMFLTPTKWFRMRHLALRGSLTEERNGRTLGGRFQVRLLGAIWFAVATWMLWRLCSDVIIVALFAGREREFLQVNLSSWMCRITCVGAIGCGALMLVSPSYWSARFGTARWQGLSNATTSLMIRISGLVCAILGLYFLVECVRG